MSKHFEFLRAEWPDVYEAATKAADAVHKAQTDLWLLDLEVRTCLE